MGAIISAEVDLSRYATAEEIAEAVNADPAPLEDMGAEPADEPIVAPPDLGIGPPVDLPIDPSIDLPDGDPGFISGTPPGVWLPNTKRHPIAAIDHGLRPQTKGVVIHVNDGYFDGTISWFSGGAGGVGAHVEIGDNRVWQLASLDRKCWHAVAANAFSIGFEHAGFGKQSRADWLNDGHELAYSANRAAWVMHEYGLGRPKGLCR